MPKSSVGAKKKPPLPLSELVDVVERNFFFVFAPTPITPTFFFPTSALDLVFCAVGQSVVRRQRNKVLLCGAAAAACRIKGATSVVFLAQRCSGGV